MGAAGGSKVAMKEGSVSGEVDEEAGGSDDVLDEEDAESGVSELEVVDPSDGDTAADLH